MVGQDVKYGKNTAAEAGYDDQEHKLGLTLFEDEHGEDDGERVLASVLHLTSSVPLSTRLGLSLSGPVIS